jgi:hypothetical protein
MAKQMVKEVLAVAPDLEDFLVPKCEKHKPYCFCTETKKRSCGRYPILKDLIGVPEGDK